MEKMVKIEVLGTSCVKCKSLLKNVETAVQESGIHAEIIKLDSIQEIMDRGVMMAPRSTWIANPRLWQDSDRGRDQEGFWRNKAKIDGRGIESAHTAPWMCALWPVPEPQVHLSGERVGRASNHPSQKSHPQEVFLR
jgi:hypothetical protein